MKPLIFVVFVVGLDTVYGQKPGDSILGALLNTFLPQLKPKGAHDTPSPAPAPPAPPSKPGARNVGGTSLSQALTGVERLPPVDFAHGFPPTFIGLTNPDNQNGFNVPMGLIGRTDLAPEYVYPFAPAGTYIRPGVNNGETFSLGQLPAPAGGGLTGLGSLNLAGLISPQAQIDNTALLQPVEPISALLNMVHLGSGPVPPSAPSTKPTPAPPRSKVVESTTASSTRETVASTLKVPAIAKKTEETSSEEDDQGTVAGLVATPRPTLPPAPLPPPPPRPEAHFGLDCPQCIPVDLRRLAGPWVQVYGNPSSLRNIYSAILNLQSLYGDGSTGGQPGPMQPACVGMQLSRPQTRGNRSESALNLYFRDDTINRQLHEAVGTLKQDTNLSPKNILIKLPAFELPVCLIKAGPDTSTMYGYIVLAETLGSNRCRSFHVFARRSDAFFRDHNIEVAEFLKEQVESNSAHAVSVLPFPELCHLRSSTGISR